MKFINPCYLLSEIASVDEIGDRKISTTERKVLCHIASIGQKEFYEAHMSGMKPEFKLVIRAIEYQGEKALVHNGVECRIIRTYDRQNGIIELTCTRGVNSERT